MSIFSDKYQHYEKGEGSIGETARVFAEKVNYHLNLGKSKIEGCQLAFGDYELAFKHYGIKPDQCIYLTEFCREFNQNVDKFDEHMTPEILLENIKRDIEGYTGLFVYLITFIACKQDSSMVQQIFNDSCIISDVIVDIQNEIFGEDRTGHLLQTLFSMKMPH